MLAEKFRELRTVIVALSYFAVFINIFYIAYIVKGKKQGKNLSSYVGVFLSKRAGIILCESVLFLGILFSPRIFSNFENTEIGSIFEQHEYREQYYIYLRPQGISTKTYRLKADIIKSDYGYQSYTDEGEETFVLQGNGYFLESVYWENGGYITFSDYDDMRYGFENTNARIYPERETLCRDKKDETYYVFLTCEKVPTKEQVRKMINPIIKD